MLVKMLDSFFFKLKYHDQNAIVTHLTVDEKRKIMELAASTSGNFVEIGSYLGASSVFISEGIIKSGVSGSILYCVDTWKNEGMLEGSRDTFAEYMENTQKYQVHIIPLRGKSIDIAKTYGHEVAFIFFDGDHSYEGIKTDVDEWLPKVKKNGIVVFHDSGWAEGVQRVIEEDIMHRIKDIGRLPNMFWGRLK